MNKLDQLKKEKNYAEIIETFEEYPDKNYSLYELNMILESYYKIKNYTKGQILSNKILEKFPDNLFTLKWKAYILFEVKDYENTKFILEKIIFSEKTPFGADIKRLYETYLKLKESENAKKLLNDYKDLLSKNEYLRGWYFKETLKTSDLEQIDGSSDYFSYLEILQKLKNISDENKVAELEKITIIKKYSKNKYVTGYLASLYVKKNQFAKAENIYKMLDKESNGTDAFIKKTLGFLYIKWDKYDKGIKILLDVLDIYIKEKPFQKLLARGIAKSSNKENYITEITRKSELSPTVNKYYYPLLAEIKKV